jgi:2-polyprenyl-3-methyl-5-hydroxy-6-metoxy-1,4-benzoquinol methylase
MESKTKVLVGIPGFAGIQPEAQESYLRMMFRAGRNLTQYDFGLAIPTKKEQFRARNYIVDRAIAGNFAYILMLDDDHIVPADLLEILMGHMESHPEYGVIGGLYYQRGGTYEPVVMRRKSTEVDDWSFEFYKHYDSIFMQPGLHEVDIIGGGCMLFRTDVFNKLIPPYFWWEYIAGTDISICGRLKDAGIRIAIDTSVELGHLGGKQIITSRTIGGLHQKMALINRTLREDVLAYLGLSELELDSEMDKAASVHARKEKWEASVKDSSSWDEVKQYYQDHGNWHITNLLHWNLQYDRFKELALRLLDGKIGAGDRILDYGPGIGHLTIPFLDAGCLADTVEVPQAPTTKFLDWRAKRHQCRKGLTLWGLDRGEVPDEIKSTHRYKAAFLISVIDHLTDPYGVIDWITAHMLPGGYFICDYMAVGSDESNPQHLDRIEVETFDNYMHSIGWDTSPEDMCMFIYRGINR